VINIVIPMAGRGSRFGGTECAVPKPLIQVLPGKRMIDYVIDYLTLPEPHRFIFICRGEHDRAYNLKNFFRGKTSGHEIIFTERLTAGPAASALLAERFIENDEELLVAYCDMFLTIDVVRFLEWSRARGADGSVISYPSANPMDSYAKIDAKDRVAETAEKVLISDTATAGLYYFRRGEDFVSAARTMLANRHGQSVELFVNPCFNELIRHGKTVFAYSIRRDEKIEMGTPDDLRQARLWLGQPVVQSIAS
jgi:NDP-sugar pyrophosphorylase family protein